MEVHERRVLEVFASEAAVSGLPWSAPVARLAVRGWLASVITVVLAWHDDPGVSRDDVRQMCTRSLLGALGFA
jgi:hypothetical protein